VGHLPFGVWRIRSAHYRPQGTIRLTSDETGCTLDFQLTFFTSGANVAAILVGDSSWEYGSNGRLEREYLEGIAAAHAQRKPPPTSETRSSPNP